MQGTEQYKYHVSTYGHPSKVGYKDLINMWHADRWDPDHLMSLYKKAGANGATKSTAINNRTTG